jgi:hypothetical protein
MSESTIQSLGIQSLVNAAKSDAKIAQMLQVAAEQGKTQTQAQTDKVTISPEAMKLLEASRG